MRIAQIIGREIYDSRGLPTVLCQLKLSDGTIVQASVPSGTSCGKHEAKELRDNDQRLFGMGVRNAVQTIETVISDEILGMRADLFEVDTFLKSLDPTPDKSKLGANTLLAVSMAVCRAQAAVEGVELFELIAHLHGSESVSLPFPLLNIFNGGMHSNNQYPLQEILLVPIGGQNFRTSFEASVEVYYALKELLDKKGKSTSVGQEGGFTPRFDHYREPFDLLVEAIGKTGHDDLFALGIDAAANSFYDEKAKVYKWFGQDLSSQELIAVYKELLDNYPLYSIEDGCAEIDTQGWQDLFDQLGGTLQIVGDDLFVTDVSRIANGIEKGMANAVLIKPNQIGTITETLQAITFCQERNANAIISHRSGETIDAFISDLAVGVNSGQIKAGGCSRGERLAKYNRLLEIEDHLTMALLDQ